MRRWLSIAEISEMKLVFKILIVSASAIIIGLAGVRAGEETSVRLPPAARLGRTLFLKNCAHCHADDATGDEGPDLHGLTRSDEWIARRIRDGKKGQMTAFGEKFSPKDVDALIAYLRTLK